MQFSRSELFSVRGAFNGALDTNVGQTTPTKVTKMIKESEKQ